jgi:hypothetical protein
MASAAEISAGLHQFARGYAYGRGFEFGNGADGHLTSSLDAFAPEASLLPDAAMQDWLREAEIGIVSFVDAMIEARRHVYSADMQMSRIIGEDTFAWAKKKLCPIIPIC